MLERLVRHTTCVIVTLWALAPATVLSTCQFRNEVAENQCQSMPLFECSLQDCVGFTQIDLSTTHVWGTIPSAVGSLSGLHRLLLGDNGLSGTIPANFGSLNSLSYFDASRNFFSGPLPVSIANAEQLIHLNLDNNQLSGPIRSDMFGLPSLKYVSMASNQFSGPLPEQLGDCVQLTELWVGDNTLTGSIPSSIGSLVNLIKLDASGNQISGLLPSSLGSLSTLTTLSLADNALSGNIPLSLCDLVVSSDPSTAIALTSCELQCTSGTECNSALQCQALTCSSEMWSVCGVCGDDGGTVIGVLLGIAALVVVGIVVYYLMRKRGFLPRMFSKAVTEGLIAAPGTPNYGRPIPRHKSKMELMQEYLSGNLQSLLIPDGSINLTASSRCVAFGGNGRVRLHHSAPPCVNAVASWCWPLR